MKPLKIDLLETTGSGGCSSKIPPGQLEEILRSLPLPSDPDILVDIDTHDDAGVYRINDELALVLTTDFFPPVCSDPYEFGQIAAANSISDVYAMGGDPVLALNIMMFPASKLPPEAYAAIMKGGFDKAAEAGVRIIGGHTIDDSTPKYGLAVVGFINPGRIITNSGARPGDMLILTKPVGTGIVMSGRKLNIASEKAVNDSITQMKQLNGKGAEIMKKHGLRGATDITGFGLAGHALKLAKASGVTVRIDMRKVPLIESVYSLADEGCIPGAAFRNLEYAEKDVFFAEDIDTNLKMIAFDAQTSGGLMMCVPVESADKILADLIAEGLMASAIIGEVLPHGDSYLQLIS